MKGVNITKKQHYIPKFYLKYFSNKNNKLYVLDIKNKRISPPKTSSAIGYEHYFYAKTTGVPDAISQTVEDWLQKFENTLANTLPKIIDKILNYDHIDDSDRYVLSVLMSMLWLRSPNMRNQIKQMDANIIKEIISLDSQKYEYDKEYSKLKLDNSQHIRFMVENLGVDSPGFTNMFFGYKWKIYIYRIAINIL